MIDKLYRSEAHKLYCDTKRIKRIERAQRLLNERQQGKTEAELAAQEGCSTGRIRQLLAGVR